MDAGQVTIKVSPETLLAKAEELTGAISRLGSDFETVKDGVTKTRAYWNGKAADAHRKAFESRYEEMDEMLRRLKEHPADLEQIAGTYLNVEKEVNELAGKLPDDIIM